MRLSRSPGHTVERKLRRISAMWDALNTHTQSLCLSAQRLNWLARLRNV